MTKKYTAIPEVPEGDRGMAMNLWLTSMSENMELLTGQRSIGRALSTDEFAQVKSLEPPADIIELSLKINQILKILKGD